MLSERRSAVVLGLRSADRLQGVPSLPDAAATTIVWMNSTERVLDYLWEHGDTVEAIAVPKALHDTLEIYHLVDLVERDWPGVRLIWLSLCDAGVDGVPT